tara:strand:- start:639 stop:926 length:288 start_codon:yes stop_codon:yes gene_type:complete
MYITEQEVIDYMFIRTDEELRHCPLAISEACNEVIEKFNNAFSGENVTAKDLLKLLFFNDPIPSLHTHSYGFHTATGRSIIETLKMKYYEYESTN